jgi:hypothetical protein
VKGDIASGYQSKSSMFMRFAIVMQARRSLSSRIVVCRSSGNVYDLVDVVWRADVRSMSSIGGQSELSSEVGEVLDSVACLEEDVSDDEIPMGEAGREGRSVCAGHGKGSGVHLEHSNEMSTGSAGTSSLARTLKTTLSSNECNSC